MNNTNLIRVFRSRALAVVVLCLALSATAKVPPALLREAFPGVDLSYLGSQPKDYAPIAVFSARTWGNPNGVEVVFTAPVDPATATNTANYTLSPGITVQRAVVGAGGLTVQLTTTTMADAVLHTLTVSNVQDLATPPNTIAAGLKGPVLKAQGPLHAKFSPALAAIGSAA